MNTPMPELPEARQFAENGIGWFTAGQMQAYAIAAIEAATEQGKRQPLSDDHLFAMLGNVFDSDDNTFISFAREIEAAHGITATPQGRL